jgi:hypothetical protein
MLNDNETGAGAIGFPAIEQFLEGGFPASDHETPAIRWTPEKHLAAAVLTDALVEVRDFLGHPAHEKQVAADLEWIFSDASDSPFSFLELCSTFDLEPLYLRQIVLHWLDDKRARAAGERNTN